MTVKDLVSTASLLIVLPLAGLFLTPDRYTKWGLAGFGYLLYWGKTGIVTVFIWWFVLAVFEKALHRPRAHFIAASSLLVSALLLRLMWILYTHKPGLTGIE